PDPRLRREEEDKGARGVDRAVSEIKIKSIEDLFDPNFWLSVLNADLTDEEKKEIPPSSQPTGPTYSDVEQQLQNGDTLGWLYGLVNTLLKDAEQLKEWSATYTPPVTAAATTAQPRVSTGRTVTPPKTIPAFLWDQALALAILTGNMAAQAMLEQGVSGLDAQRWISAYVNLIRTLADIARGAEE
ncbi:MAG: hypothetical protein QW512_05540, partial [Thermofilaceae archaeon]